MAGFKYLIEPMPSVTCATRRALAPLVMLGLPPPGDHERGPVTRRRAAAMSRAGQTTFEIIICKPAVKEGAFTFLNGR